ncbi:hypothetical protein D1B31_16170 [Neobacillus notoginsengisoli]|uniref:Uncharacterized protein n=1 Tax=Neobacillus notoginsengisoli TaxID=1578198 RepID=A0A417YR21_9BACI|nr:hypothetical protein [Neobacillus notoginsengisoli]RHW37301.1 hypothetical protein D1B31_16170 [Neobacillus notoginsengisoli]
MNRPNNHKISVTFYKESGKYYSSGTAVVNHFMFEDGYKQDIVNTQDCLRDGWQEHSDFYVVTSASDDVDGFHEALYKPGAFKGIKRE